MKPEPLQMNPEEWEDILERGGPWITLTFTSEDQMFVQQRVMTIAQAESLVTDLSAQIESAKIEYNISEVNDD
jgi:hypothetical protein